MRNGFTFALFAAVFAAASVRSHAETPIIKSVPDVIIGNLEDGTQGATSTSNFVFPDALDLRDLFISDDTESADTLKWSFASNDPSIKINGVDSLDLNSDDPAEPPVGSRLDLVNNDAGSTAQPSDSNPYTLTFRDIDPPAVFSEASQEAVVTLFASDCTDFAQKEFSVFSVDGAEDEIGSIAVIDVVESDFGGANGAGDWVGGAFLGVLDITTGLDLNGLTGLCVGSGAAGDFGGQWKSPDDLIEVTANTVWRARMVLTTDQTDTSLVPYVRMLWTNADVQSGGIFVYGGEHFSNGTSGGANAIGTLANHDFYFAPIGAGTTQFAAAVADPANADVTDISLELSLLDVNANLAKDSAFGMICLASVDIDAMNIDELLGVSSVAFEAPIDTANYTADLVVDGTVTIAGGTITLSPNSQTGAAPADLGFVSYIPNDSTVSEVLVNGLRNTLKFDPVVWESNTLYVSEIDVSATGADTPYLLAMPFDILTVESASSSFGALGDETLGLFQATLPNTTEQPFRSFWFSHSASADSGNIGQDAARFRNPVQVFNKTGLRPAWGDDDYVIGGIRTLKVDGVDIP
jgi:hypothetical protein